jgi:hypothetical protein
LGFFVLAPASQIARGLFDDKVTRQSVRKKVSRRVGAYQDPARDAWLADWFSPLLERMRLDLVSWEAVLDAIGNADPQAGAVLDAFYRRCLDFNKVAP